MNRYAPDTDGIMEKDEEGGWRDVRIVFETDEQREERRRQEAERK